MSLGEAFACGLVVDGSVACWGDGQWGIFGGSTTDSNTPTMVPNTGPGGSVFTGARQGRQEGCTEEKMGTFFISTPCNPGVH